jgi:FkbM family methyltransferase
MHPDAELERLLGEPLDAADARSRETYDRLTGTRDRLVLFGAGGLGRKTLAGLRSLGISPLAFADNNQRLWGTRVEGLEVLPPMEVAAAQGRHASFVITIWGAYSTHRMSTSRSQLEALGCRHVTHFGHLYWKHPETFLPYYCLDHPRQVLLCSAAVRKAYALLADEPSRWEFVKQLRFRLFLDFDSLVAAPGEEYFPDDLFDLRADEVFIDCGAFDGDTIQMLRERSAFKQVIALEPDPVNFAKLQEWCGTLPEAGRIQTFPWAVGADRGKIRFEATGTMASKAGEGSLEVDVVPLDELLREPPTFIKMDIEGAEPEALLGAGKLIARHDPLLAISAYHQQDHLWRILSLIESFSDRYRFFLRAHDNQGWGLVCYAIPAERVKG